MTSIIISHYSIFITYCYLELCSSYSWNSIVDFGFNIWSFLSPRIDLLFFNLKKDGVERRIYYIGNCGGRENWRAGRFLKSPFYTKKPSCSPLSEHRVRGNRLQLQEWVDYWGVIMSCWWCFRSHLMVK